MPDRRISTAVKNAEKRRRAKEDAKAQEKYYKMYARSLQEEGQPKSKGLSGPASPPKKQPPKSKPKYTASSNTVASTIALPRNKEIPKGSKGAGLRALPPGVVEDMGYKPITRLNRNMEMETLKPINATAMGALTRPMEQIPLSRMYNSALPKASKLSKAKFPLMPTKYMNPPKMGTIFSKANKSKKK